MTVTDSTLQLFCKLVSNNNLCTQLLLKCLEASPQSSLIPIQLKILSNSMDVPRNCYASGHLSCSIIKLFLRYCYFKILLSLGQNAS